MARDIRDIGEVAEDPDAPRRMLRALPWLAALGLFLFVRAWGIEFGSPPRMVHPDERYATLADRMGPDLHPQYFSNPPGFTYALYAVKQVRILALGEESTRRWIDAGGLVLASRRLSAILGALTALVVGAAARRLFDSPHVGVAAAVIVGFSFLHGRDSHYGLPDVPMVFCVAVSTWAACRALTGPGRRWLLLSAAAAGLAAAVKYNGALVLALPLAVPWLRTSPSPAGARLAASAALGAVACGSFLLFNPYAVLDFPMFWDHFHEQLTVMGDSRTWAQPRGPGWLLYLRASAGLLGWALLVAVPVGLLLLLRARRREALLVSLFPVLYMAGMLGKLRFHWRFALPLLPFLAILAAVACVALARAVAGRRRSHAIGTTLAVVLGLATLEPALRLLKHDQLLTRDDTWIQAADWIDANLPPGANVFLECGIPRVLFPDHVRLWYPDVYFRLGTIVDVGEDGRPRRAVDEGGWMVTDGWRERAAEVGGRVKGRDTSEWPGLLAGLRERHGLVAEFSPGPHGEPETFEFDSRFGPLVDFWSQKRPGYTIRIYRIEPGTWVER
jgi:hypothetical protein